MKDTEVTTRVSFFFAYMCRKWFYYLVVITKAGFFDYFTVQNVNLVYFGGRGTY